MHNKALAIILDEHRSLAAVLHAMLFIIRDFHEKNTVPDYKTLWAMIYYMEAFSDRLHNPREDTYLFSKLKIRTGDADNIISALEKQHSDSYKLIGSLKTILGEVEAGV